MKLLYFGLGEKLDVFFAMEDGEILKVFYNESKCNKYIEKENKKRKDERKTLFD